jgi:uncharacterized membrane protein
MRLLAVLFMLASPASAATGVVAVAGRMHIALLHIPLAALLLALFVAVFFRNKIDADVRDRVVGALVGVACLSAVLTVASGFILSDEEDYAGKAANTLWWHRAGGVTVAVMSLLSLATYTEKKYTVIRLPLLAVASVLVLLVGHLGGNLVHGENYVFAPLLKRVAKENDDGARVAVTSDGAEADGSATARGRFPEGTVPDKPDFATHIKPLFERSCVGCHGPSKRKSGLRLDEKRYALKGGESGAVSIVAGDPDKSLVYTMCALPPDDEEVMPERGKLLALSEIETLKKWIAQGAVWPD